jgi:hypothetical protein
MGDMGNICRVKCEAHNNPLVANIERYDLSDLHTMYKRYSHKSPKHALLYITKVHR